VAEPELVEFDEDFYLRTYPDVAAAVAGGGERSALNHYLQFGRLEGRLPVPVDEAFYLRSYPLAVREISAGRAANAATHYLKIGRARGYLPRADAPRPDYAAALPSRFGGLWIDQPHVHDLIDGKLDIGLITARQARLLRQFADQGYVIQEQAIPPELVSRARAELEAVYSGRYPELWFECKIVSPELMHWRPEINNFNPKALDLHHFCPAIRELVFSDRIVEFLGLIFESKVFASQTVGFWRGLAQEPHQDSASVAYTLPRSFAASWVALEDVMPGAGELFYYPGSHRFQDFLYAERFKSVAEAKRMTGVEGGMDEERERHVRALGRRAEALGIKRASFAAKAGDVLIWHADLVNGGQPAADDVTQKSVVTHYCPKYAAPTFTEHMKASLGEQDGHLFTTSYYCHET